MKTKRSGLFLVCVFLASTTLAQTEPAKKAGGATSSPAVMPGSEKWMDLPAAALVGTPSVEMGGTVKIAILQGDPMTAGRSYTVRLSCTDGTKIAPHWHPATENATVLKGDFEIGMGSKWDPAAMTDLPAGAFISAPAKMRHFGQCKGDTLLQLNGIGPLVINFVAPGDDKPAM